MTNTFLSRKVVASAAILLGGLLVAGGILISANFASAQSVSPQSAQWTQPVGLGLSVPACASSQAPVTCSGNKAQVIISWADFHDLVNLDVCEGTWCTAVVYTSGGWDNFSLPTSGSVTINNLKSNQLYTYALRDLAGGSIAYPTFTTPNCGAPTNRTLSVNSSGASSVVISGSPSTYGGTTNYTETVADGTVLSLTAPASKGSADFSSWSGCNSTSGTDNRTCNVTMTANKTVTANYTVPPQPPTTPILNNITPSCSSSNVPQAVLSWTASPSTGITEYHIERCTGSSCTNFAQIATDTASPYTNTGLAADTRYRYRLRSHDHTTNLFSAYSNIVAVTTLDNCAPPLPDLTAGAVSPTSATAGSATSFSAVISNIGEASTGAGFTNLFQRATNSSGANAADIGTVTRLNALSTGGSANISFSYAFRSSDAGTTRYLRACADKSAATDNGVVTESNENNNCGPWTAISVSSPPTFNYTLSNSGTSSVTKTSGDAFTQNTITKTLTAGTTQSVTLSLSGVPSGTSYSISNAACSPTCASVITFTVSPSTNVGTYPITVTGSPLNKQTTFNLVVSGSPMTVSCSASPSTALVGETVTWTASVSGGTPPLSYSWSGTSIPTSPAPSTNPFSISYSTIGQKNTAVTVTDVNSVRSECFATLQINFNPNFEEF